MKARLAAILLAIMPASGLAAPTAPELTAAEASEERGRQMFAYDQAAWHATDRFREHLALRGMSLEDMLAGGLSGYIVEPADDGSLLATFFGDRNEQRFAIARYSVIGSRVAAGGLIEEDGARDLSLLALRMIDARQRAIGILQAARHELCSESEPNTLVLPPDSAGTISVYILTSTVVEGVYPAGGHYRFDFDPEGELVAERCFMNSCFPLSYERTEDREPLGLVLSHLLDPHPTEIHVFVSLNIPVHLFVATLPNRRIWRISAGEIQYVSDIEEN